MLKLAALGIFSPYIEQAYTRRFAAHDFSGIEASHIGKLKKILCSAFHICSAVNQHDAVLTRRQHRSERSPADPADTPYRKCGSGQESSCRAGGNRSISLPVSQQL